MTVIHDEAMRAALQAELVRQRTNIELIASENIVSEEVLAVMGSVLTNKYAEGYPSKRYYGGCDAVDVAETLAIDRACTLFGAQHANVQPHSGAQANMAVYLATLKYGDVVLGMSLAHGGHLTHGSPVNASGIGYTFASYGVDPVTHRIDYDQVRTLAMKHRPRMIVAGASAYARVIDFAAFASIAHDVGALFFVDMAHIAGLVAGGVHPSPVPHAHVVTTTTHKTLRGPRGGLILCQKPWAKAIDKAVFPGMQGGPLMHVIAAKGIAFGEALQPSFADYARRIVHNAQTMAEQFLAEDIPLISGGTDNHLLLLDLRPLGITGKKAEHVLDRVGLTVNKNAIPDDPAGPMTTSGIRIGTPAVTTRGMTPDDMRTIAKTIASVLRAPDSDAVCAQAQRTVATLTERYPLYPAITYERAV